MSVNWTEFLTIAIVHFFAVASPGPDFAIVLKQAIEKGRKAAIWTSFGIGTGILLHVAYSLLGISIVISTTPWLFTTLLYLAAAYLCWIGINALRSQSKNDDKPMDEFREHAFSKAKAFMLGFITNGLNPKATLFFLSVFTVAISIKTPLVNKTFYGVYMAFATGLWFCFLSMALSQPKVRKIYINNGYIFDKLMGVILIVMAIMLIFRS